MSRRGWTRCARSSRPGTRGRRVGRRSLKRCSARSIRRAGCRFRRDRKLEESASAANYYYNDPKNAARILYKEGVFVGYRGYQKSNVKPQFPFGYGLSYTSFEYGNLKVSAASGSPKALSTT